MDAELTSKKPEPWWVNVVWGGGMLLLSIVLWTYFTRVEIQLKNELVEAVAQAPARLDAPPSVDTAPSGDAAPSDDASASGTAPSASELDAALANPKAILMLASERMIPGLGFIYKVCGKVLLCGMLFFGGAMLLFASWVVYREPHSAAELD